MPGATPLRYRGQQGHSQQQPKNLYSLPYASCGAGGRGEQKITSTVRQNIKHTKLFLLAGLPIQGAHARDRALRAHGQATVCLNIYSAPSADPPTSRWQTVPDAAPALLLPSDALACDNQLLALLACTLALGSSCSAGGS